MNANWAPYILAVGANLCFGTASITFSKFSVRFSANWINQLKVCVAFVGFILTFLFFEHFTPLPFRGYLYLLSSGFLGLCLGDFFLFRSLGTLGPTRTLILYTFQPLLLGVYGYFFLNQDLNPHQFAAIACMIFCIMTFIYERNQKTGSFDLRSFSFAFIGVFFDAIGVMLSRQAYELDRNLGSSQVNATRALGALLGFVVLSPRFLLTLKKDIFKLTPKDRFTAIGACILGTFVSLSLYLLALKTAHVATLTAISITSPLWVSLIEHLKGKRWPDLYLWTALFFFLVGFFLMQWH